MIRLSDFSGTWQMSRVIDDAMSGGRGTLEGRCRFYHDARFPDMLVQEERGVMFLPGVAKPMEASRRYLWQEAPDGQGLTVFFDDQRFFHAFDPNAAAPEAHHDCAPDSYDVRYDFSRWHGEGAPGWHARWRVKGPRKDYVSVTRYTWFAGGA